MARRRMIDPNFWDSEDVSRLTIMERLLLIGLFSNADDFGKGRGKSITIRSKIFPNDDLSIKTIESAIENIKRNINILFYDVDGNIYYKFTNWCRWQRVDHPQTSSIPDPYHSENDSENDSENESGNKNDSENDSKNDSKNGTVVIQYNIKESNIGKGRFDNEALNEAFNAFMEMRKSIKKPMTDKAIALLISTMNGISKDQNIQIKMLENAITHNWLTVYPLKQDEQPRQERLCRME
jgi:hypothetical protein